MSQSTPQGHDAAYFAGFEAGLSTGLDATSGITQDYRRLKDAAILLATVAYLAVAWLAWIYVRRLVAHDGSGSSLR